MADDKKFTEDAYEQTLIALFRDELGYAYECGYDVERDYKEPFYRADLVASMRRLNPQLPADAMDARQGCTLAGLLPHRPPQR